MTVLDQHPVRAARRPGHVAAPAALRGIELLLEQAVGLTLCMPPVVVGALLTFAALNPG